MNSKDRPSIPKVLFYFLLFSSVGLAWFFPNALSSSVFILILDKGSGWSGCCCELSSGRAALCLSGLPPRLGSWSWAGLVSRWDSRWVLQVRRQAGVPSCQLGRSFPSWVALSSFSSPVWRFWSCWLLCAPPPPDICFENSSWQIIYSGDRSYSSMPTLCL